MFHVIPAAHAKPHAQQQIARDLEVDYETNPPMSEGHPISMVCSRSGVRVYAATPRSGPCLLCAAARFMAAVNRNVTDGVPILAKNTFPTLQTLRERLRNRRHARFRVKHVSKVPR